ncbi:unnamed protein product [Orchesella dallaii]|uniref:alpha-glucosidase n=1 Tax=Orchesella dallaii TaxID=48710 RepID=A0ABP1Q591_9HEXA
MKHVLAFCLLAISFRLSSAIKLPQNPDPQPLKWWQSDIIYQIYPRSHQDSDGDGVGDLKGIESRLDHFVELGIGSVWISPIYQSPMKDFGYDISNFTNIEPTFGTLDDFRSLSDAMKERGLKLIMDFVPNHSSDMHAWFNKSIHSEGKYKDYYVWKDPKGYDAEGNPIPPANWVNHFGGSSFEWNEIRQQFYLHQFVKEQPDLNYENPEVMKEMLAAMKFWLDAGVDGFRMDAVQTLFEDQRFLDEPVNPDRPANSIPSDHKYWKHIYTINQPKVIDALVEFRKLIDIYTLADGKERCMMTEAYLDTLEELLPYYGTKENPAAHFPFNFDLIVYANGSSGATTFANIIDEWYLKKPEGATVNWLVGNHDNFRIGSRYGEDAIDKMNMLIMLLPGSVVTYYGEEIGMVDNVISWEDTVDPWGCNAGPDRYSLFSRDPERCPMQWSAEDNAGFSTANKTWLPVHPNHKQLNVEAQKNTTGESHLKVYKRLSDLRKTEAWQFGGLEAKTTNDGEIYGYSRIFNNQGFLFLGSFSNQTVTVNATQEFEGIPSTATVYTTNVGFEPETAIGSSISTSSIVVGAKHSIIVAF